MFTVFKDKAFGFKVVVVSDHLTTTHRFYSKYGNLSKYTTINNSITIFIFSKLFML